MSNNQHAFTRTVSNYVSCKVHWATFRIGPLLLPEIVKLLKQIYFKNSQMKCWFHLDTFYNIHVTSFLLILIIYKPNTRRIGSKHDILAPGFGHWLELGTAWYC